MKKSERNFQRALQDVYRRRLSPLDSDQPQKSVPSRDQTNSDDVEWTAEDWEHIWWRTSG